MAIHQKHICTMDSSSVQKIFGCPPLSTTNFSFVHTKRQWACSAQSNTRPTNHVGLLYIFTSVSASQVAICPSPHRSTRGQVGTLVPFQRLTDGWVKVDAGLATRVPKEAKWTSVCPRTFFGFHEATIEYVDCGMHV
jgi:hypothetical protein